MQATSWLTRVSGARIPDSGEQLRPRMTIYVDAMVVAVVRASRARWSCSPVPGGGFGGGEATPWCYLLLPASKTSPRA